MRNKSPAKKAAAPTAGWILADMRRAGGWSQAEFAARAGVEVASLRNWEQDRRQLTANQWLDLLAAAGARVEVTPADCKRTKGGAA